MDDGGGFISAWEAVRVLKQLNIIPLRTIRAVVWVNEENGDAGGKQYFQDFNSTGALLNHSIAIETDSGAFTPLGLGISCANNNNGGCAAAKAQMQILGTLLAPIGGGLVSDGGGGADIEPMCSVGIVCSGLNVLDPRLSTGTNNPCIADAMGAWTAPVFNAETATATTQYDSGYFFFHHSEADTIERIDPYQLNHVSAALAIWTFSIAQLPSLLPRDDPAPTRLKLHLHKGLGIDMEKVVLWIVGAMVLSISAWCYALYCRKNEPALARALEEEGGSNGPSASSSSSSSSPSSSSSSSSTSTSKSKSKVGTVEMMVRNNPLVYSILGHDEGEREGGSSSHAFTTTLGEEEEGGDDEEDGRGRRAANKRDLNFVF